MKHLLSSITLLFLSTVAFGQVPNTFSSGETISSSKINANFAYLADGILKDNVTAMMVCQAEGFTESGVYYYASCYSSDDQTFEGTVSLKIKLSLKILFIPAFDITEQLSIVIFSKYCFESYSFVGKKWNSYSLNIVITAHGFKKQFGI